MKPVDRRFQAASRAAFPGLLGRGLIEAVASATKQDWQGGLSPVYWAGASLKHWADGELRAEERWPFPGLLGRGLIEAGCMFEHLLCLF